MNLDNIHSVYFIGIGGIGMSALARFFNERGVNVSGYDKTQTNLTKQLEAEGIQVHYVEDIEQLNAKADLVIYTPAIPSQNKELIWYQQQNISLYKRADILQLITEQMYAITVAGTHGKTTTSSLIAHIFRNSGVGCNAFLGGIATNYNKNYWSSNNNVAVIEADEYDRSFLKLKPTIGILTAMEADHLDIYGNIEAVEEAYIAYTKQIVPEGKLIYKHGIKGTTQFHNNNKASYSLQNSAADIYAKNIQIRKGGYKFDVVSNMGNMHDVELHIGGMHNVENTIAAIAAAQTYDISEISIKQAIACFEGVKRRFEYVINTDKITYIDDYAHHPAELNALLKSVKALFSKKKCVIAFQPHLFTRTRDFAQDFAESLDIADEVILLDIYPAREEPINQVNSELIKSYMGNPNCTILSKQGLLDYVKHAPVELLITAGAGDIDQLVQPIKEILEERYKN